jgi:hypothetical protein
MGVKKNATKNVLPKNHVKKFLQKIRLKKSKTVFGRFSVRGVSKTSDPSPFRPLTHPPTAGVPLIQKAPTHLGFFPNKIKTKPQKQCLATSYCS